MKSTLHALNPTMDAALNYAKQGWPVFPCNPGTKQPYTRNGFKAATTDANQIIDWWSKYPKAMIGFPTGAASGIVVLDIDIKPGANGAEELAKLERLHGPLPTTLRASTPSGGLHIYFQYADGIRNRGSFEPGIDVRGEGGYVILPGSVRDDGCFYEWKNEGTPIAAAPAWLLELVKPATPKPKDRTSIEKSNPTYSQAAITDELQKLVGTPMNRNNQLNDSSFAIGQFIGAGEISRNEAEQRLYGAALANGYIGKDGEVAARATIRSGLDAGEREPRDIPESDNDGLPEADPAWVIRWAERQIGKKGNGRFQITWFDDVNQTAVKEEILKGVLGDGEFSLLVAKPGTAKSVLACDIGCHIAAGIDWHGRKVKQGLVVFFAAERKRLTERRVAAWRKRHGVTKIPFVVVGGKLDLTTGLVDAKALANTIAELESKSGHSCVLIILDTVTRTFGPGDQHQSRDMSRYIQSVDALNHATGAHILCIHHSTWSDERGKGAIDLDGAIDVSFVVNVNGTGAAKQFTFSCTGSNDGEDGAISTFKLESVTLGTDDEGNETTAPVVIQTEAKVKTRNHADLVFESLERAIEEHGVEVPDDTRGFPPGTIAVQPDRWRDTYCADCRATEPNVKDGTLKKRYQRAVDELVKAQKVGRFGQWNWIMQPEVTLH